MTDNLYDLDYRTYACPECERPNQFGELCEKCRAEIAAEADEQGANDDTR